MKVICYLSYGYPTIEYSLKMAACYRDAGCDMIEVSLPARNPYLDTEFIAGRMADALAECSDYDVYLDKLAGFRSENPDLPMVFVLYEDTMLEIGVDKLIGFMKTAGIGDVIYAGRINHPEVKEKLIREGIGISCPVTYQMLDEEVEAAVNSNGFVYMEGRPQNGTREGFETLEKCISHLRGLGITRPIYCGVGIRTIEDVIYAREAGGDGIFIGSALIRLYDKPDEMMQKIRDFRHAATQ